MIVKILFEISASRKYPRNVFFTKTNNCVDIIEKKKYTKNNRDVSDNCNNYSANISISCKTHPPLSTWTRTLADSAVDGAQV